MSVGNPVRLARLEFSSVFKHLLLVSLLGFQLVFLLRTSDDVIVRSDFAAFYSAARLWQAGANPYDLMGQCKLQASLRPGLECLPLAHPPVLIPFIAIVSNENFFASYWRWLSLLILMGLASSVPLYLLTRDVFLTFESLLFLPVVVGLMLGQDAVFLLFAILMWCYLLLNRRDFASGLLLAVTTIKPQFAILLALPLATVRPRAFAGFLTGAATLLAYSFALVGISGFRGLLGITRVMSKGQGFGINQMDMPNITGILVGSGAGPMWSWAIFLMGLIVIAFLWRLWGISKNTLAIGIVLALFSAPHVHTHDLSLLLLPLSQFPPLVLVTVSVALFISVGLDVLPGAACLLMFILLCLLVRKQQASKKQSP